MYPIDHNYIEGDPSPMATLMGLYEAEQAQDISERYWGQFCSLDPSALECRVYDD